MTQEELNQKLFDAVYIDNINGIKEALSLGADANSADIDGDTALMYACWDGYTDIARLLIEYGADINKQNNTGYIAFTYACKYGYIEIVKMMLENRADINIVSKHGDTALINACWNGHIDIAKLLIEYGADINIRYRSGQTALDILKEKYPAKYKRWMEHNIKKQRETKLRLEDSTDRQNIQPDWNI